MSFDPVATHAAEKAAHTIRVLRVLLGVLAERLDELDRLLRTDGPLDRADLRQLTDALAELAAVAYDEVAPAGRGTR